VEFEDWLPSGGGEAVSPRGSPNSTRRRPMSSQKGTLLVDGLIHEPLGRRRACPTDRKYPLAPSIPGGVWDMLREPYSCQGTFTVAIDLGACGSQPGATGCRTWGSEAFHELQRVLWHGALALREEGRSDEPRAGRWHGGASGGVPD
jgi:hypothetical protein